jgi:death-on-curing protein
VDVIYLTADQILTLHEMALEEGGLAGVRSQQALLSAIGQVGQTVFGEDAYPTLAEKAAAYAFFVIAGHPFNDGNKRTGSLAMELFLDLNGFELQQTDAEIEDMVISVAAGTVDQGEFFGWVVNHAKPKGMVADVVAFKKDAS